MKERPRTHNVENIQNVNECASLDHEPRRHGSINHSHADSVTDVESLTRDVLAAHRSFVYLSVDSARDMCGPSITHCSPLSIRQ